MPSVIQRSGRVIPASSASVWLPAPKVATANHCIPTDATSWLAVIAHNNTLNETLPIFVTTAMLRVYRPAAAAAGGV